MFCVSSYLSNLKKKLFNQKSLVFSVKKLHHRWQAHKQTPKQTDIATYRLNCRFSENGVDGVKNRVDIFAGSATVYCPHCCSKLKPYLHRFNRWLHCFLNKIPSSMFDPLLYTLKLCRNTLHCREHGKHFKYSTTFKVTELYHKHKSIPSGPCSYLGT